MLFSIIIVNKRARLQTKVVEDIHSILKNTTLFSSRRVITERTENLLVMDPPKHTQMRNLVNKAFTPKKVNDLTPRIAEITQTLLDDVKQTDQWDMVKDLAGPLPVIVIAELLGIPTKDRLLLKEWSDALVKGPEVNNEEAYHAVMAEREEAVNQLNAYFRNIIRERGSNQKDDLISLLLLVAGNETTTIASAFFLWYCGMQREKFHVK